MTPLIDRDRGAGAVGDEFDFEAFGVGGDIVVFAAVCPLAEWCDALLKVAV
jgi:hypothetical protein